MTLPIWGWANPGKTVTVAFAGQKQSAVFDANGNVRLHKLPASPFRTDTLHGVTVGNH